MDAVSVVGHSCSVAECTSWCTYGGFEWESDGHRMELDKVLDRSSVAEWCCVKCHSETVPSD